MKVPVWETPEQYEKRTGEVWPDDAPVWSRYRGYDTGCWSLDCYDEAKEFRAYGATLGKEYDVICATESGLPPDDWKPEEAEE